MKRCLILMLLLGLLLTGCRKQTQPEQLPTAETIDTQANTEPAAQTPEQTLTLGMIDFDSEKSVLRSMIQSYNFSGAPFRIEILNYADGAESRADAVTRMTTELLAGNVPDLLDCSDLSGAQYAGYAKNGILLPLDGMPDAELLSGILKPCYVDGTLYSVVGAFALDPLFGPAEKLGASLETSVEDVLCGAVPDVSFFWGGEDLLSVYCRHAAEEALRNMLQEDFQLTIADAFPVNRAALRELMQKEIEAQKAEQQTAIREEGRVEIGEAGDLAFLFDEAAADDLMNVLEHADCRSCGSQEILMIILDEADAFFKGRKTAQEAAQVMDRRAALFIAEAG